MYFAVLGPLKVVDGEAEIELGGPLQQRVLACLLAAHPESLSADQLIFEVWNDDPPETASHVLRTYLSNLRGAMNGRIVSDRHHYRLDTSRDQVDAAEFTDLLTEADTIRRSNPGRAASILAAAEGLWRGRPFGSLGDGSLLLERRALEMQTMRLRAAEMRIEAELDLGRHGSVLPQLQVLADANPYREHLHQLLMLALYRDSRQADALRAGFALRERMVDELGIEPSPETRRVEDRILRQDADLELAPPSNLPRFASSFVGRGAELSVVTKHLESNRLVTLIGVGGIGKTRLAVESAGRSADQFPDGVWWADLAALAPASPVAPRVAEALNIAAQPGVDAIDLVRRFVARRSMLILLDNCERIVGVVAKLVRSLLEGAPGLKILATSRRALNVPGEQRYEVPAMNLPAG